MATIQRDSGEVHRGSTVYVWEAIGSDDQQGAKGLVLHCEPSDGDKKDGFPIRLTLTRNELLELVADICNSLLPGAQVRPALTPPPYQPVSFAKDHAKPASED